MTRLIRHAMALATALFTCVSVHAQAWPSKPVRLVTAFAAGSASDIVARMLAAELQTAFNQSFVVDNKPGASGIIAAEAVAKSAPDGYTIFLTTNTANSSNPHLFKKLPYDAIRDFTPIARICYFPFVLAVNASLPVQTPRELIEYARNSKQPISYGYGNSTGQIASAAFNTLTQINATAVPYKSSPQVLTDLIGGQITFLFGDLASSAAHIKSGRIRAIAVSTERRSVLAPDLPTVASAVNLPGFDLAAWVGIVGPAHMPADITQKLSVEINRIVARKDITDKLLAMGAEPAPALAAEFGDYMRQQLTVWGQKTKDAGIQPE